MLDFVAHKYDVLLATTIIENGLDIPNANTIIINRADRYGLSQLYQLRGRVGRSDRRGLRLPADPARGQRCRRSRRSGWRRSASSATSGSGFRVAALDLEIRGAGNLLGGEQSGHIEAVGFDMYMKLLEQTDQGAEGRGARGRGPRQRQPARRPADRRDLHPGHEPAADGLPADGRACAPTPSCDRLMDEVRDRYGPPPESVLNLAEYASIRLLADRIGLESIDREGQTVVLKFRPEAKLDPAVALPRRPGARGPDADPAGHAEDGPARRAGRAALRRWRPRQDGRCRQPAEEGWRSGRGRLVVGGPGQRRRGHVRVHPGGDPEAREGGPAGRGRRVRPGCGPAARVERRAVDRLKFCDSAS